MSHFPEGHFPEGHFPQGHFPQYTPLAHSAVDLRATVRRIGRTLVTSSFSFISGNSIVLEFFVTDHDENPVDITPDTVRFAIARGLSKVVSSDDSGVTVDLTEASQGKFKVRIPDESTSGLLGTYKYQAEIEDVSGDKATVASGYITFRENVLASAS